MTSGRNNQIVVVRSHVEQTGYAYSIQSSRASFQCNVAIHSHSDCICIFAIKSNRYDIQGKSLTRSNRKCIRKAKTVRECAIFVPGTMRINYNGINKYIFIIHIHRCQNCSQFDTIRMTWNVRRKKNWIFRYTLLSKIATIINENFNKTLIPR